MAPSLIKKALFLLVSVGAHLIVLWILRVPYTVQLSTPPTYEVDLLAGRQVVAVSPLVPVPPARDVVKAAPIPSRIPSAPRPRNAITHESAPGLPPLPSTDPRTPRPFPHAGPPSPMLSMRPPPLDLQPSWSKIIAPTGKDSPGKNFRRETPRPDPPDDSNETIKQRLDQLLGQDQAVQNVQVGRVHPTLFDIGRDARKLMHPTWALADGDQREIGTVVSSNKAFWRSWMKGYMQALERQASKYNDRPRDNDDMSMLDIYHAMKQSGQDNARAFNCQLCVTIGLQTMPKIQIKQSSNRKPFDNLALNALRTALRLRPPPQDLKPVKACYRLSAIFDRVPILPLAGCSFDESELSLSCYYPTMKQQDTKVELLSAELIVEPKS